METLGAKGEVYRLLSRVYHTPENSFLKGDFLDLFRKAFDILSLEVCAREVEKVQLYLHTLQESADLAVEYTRLFRGPVKAEAYPYESIYIDGEIMGNSALDVVRRYQEAEVAVSPDFTDLPDHISAELEFMYYLCVREVDALQRGEPDEAARFRLLGYSFLSDHLGRWAPKFAELVLQGATTPFYLGIATITREFINRETSLSRPNSS